MNDQYEFQVKGVARECWSNASPIRKIFKNAFEGAGVKSFNPHSFRKTLVTLGEQLCASPEEFKAWSQNLGHEKVLTTFTSYGEVQPHKQSAIFKKLKETRIALDQSEAINELARAVLSQLKDGKRL